MKILCSSENKIPASKQVIRLGNYIYNHLDGAYKQVRSGNTVDVYSIFLYQLRPEYGGKVNDVQEMQIDINLTTYQNKVRLNVVEITPMERTLGSSVISEAKLEDLRSAMDYVLQLVAKHITRSYKEYMLLY